MSATWACPTCKVQVTTPFCPTCGEHPLRAGELSLRTLLRKLLVIFTNVDAKVLRTLRCLVIQPGVLTQAFYEGRRKPYLGGFQIFILCNVIFFAVQTFANTKVFSNTLDLQLGTQPMADWGQMFVDARLGETGRTPEQYAPLFNQAVATNAKSLIGLMVPFFALAGLIVCWPARRPYAVHVIFALHFFAFFLLLLSVPLLGTIVHEIFGGSGILGYTLDKWVSATWLIASGVYIYLAIGPAYGARGFTRVIQAIVLTMAAAYIFLGYRFALLPITLYTT